MDEIWSFGYSKQKNVAMAKGNDEALATLDVDGLDADTKLIVSWMVGGRDGDYAMGLMDDLRNRLATRVQLTTDGHRAYLDAVEGAFGGDMDYAHAGEAVRRGSERPRAATAPPNHRRPQGADRGQPGPGARRYRYTSSGITFRCGCRCVASPGSQTRSQRSREPLHMLALYFVWYNWIRHHKAHRLSLATAGLTDKFMNMEDVVALIDDVEMQATITKRAALLLGAPRYQTDTDLEAG